MSKSSMADFNNLWMSYEILMRIPNHFRTKQKKKKWQQQQIRIDRITYRRKLSHNRWRGFTQYYCNKNQNNNQKKKKKKMVHRVDDTIFLVVVVVVTAVITAS